MMDIRSQYSSAVYLPSKTVSRYSITEVLKFVQEVSRCEFVIQTDGESALRSLMKEVNKSAPGLRTRIASVGSSQSNGSIERFHQTLTAQIRTMHSKPKAERKERTEKLRK